MMFLMNLMSLMMSRKKYAFVLICVGDLCCHVARLNVCTFCSWKKMAMLKCLMPALDQTSLTVLHSLQTDQK